MASQALCQAQNIPRCLLHAYVLQGPITTYVKLFNRLYGNFESFQGELRFRMKRYVDMLSKGEDIPPVVLRKNDEFKDFAESLDKLRTYLKGKGLLESKE